MELKFLDWYTQALGSALGILACIYAYLNGYMFVYGNIEGYFDFLGFSGVISSYLLLPLCLISLLLSLIKSYTIKKDILNNYFETINVSIITLTVIIGFMGAKIYFLIPAVFILFNIFEPYIHTSYMNKALDHNENILDNNKNKSILNETIEFTKIEDDTSYEINDLYTNKANNQKVFETKKEIAIQLLKKNSSKQFIIELTGFTLDEIDMLDEEVRINNI